MTPLIDAHVHLPSPEVFKWHEAEKLFASMDEAVACLKKCGVTGIIFNLWRGLSADTEEDLEIANARALALHDREPGFFYPGACIHPAFPVLSEKWLKAFRERNLVWVGELVPYRSDIPFSDPGWMRLLEICRRHGQVVQLHGTPEVIAIARSMPDLRIVSAHIFPELLVGLAACPNVWLDLSGIGSGERIGRMETALKHFGPDRLLWGTDFTVFDPAVFYLRALNAFPDPDVRRKIFSENVLRLLTTAGSTPALSKGNHVSPEHP